MKKTGHVILAALCLSSFASGDTIDASRLSEPLKLAYESLGKMGLTVEKVRKKFISGNYAVAIPTSAIIEEKGKAYVVIIDPKNPSMTDRHEVDLGNQSEKYVHARSAVSSGDYVVVRKEDDITKSASNNQSAQRIVPRPNTNSRDIARVTPSSFPYQSPAAPTYLQPSKPAASPPSVTRTYTRPPVNQPVYSPPPVDQRYYSQRQTPRNWQPSASAVPISTYQPRTTPSEPYRDDFGYRYNPEPYATDNGGCSICNQSRPEPFRFSDYSNVPEYYPEDDYRTSSGCFTEPLCRAFRSWFN